MAVPTNGQALVNSHFSPMLEALYSNDISFVDSKNKFCKILVDFMIP